MNAAHSDNLLFKFLISIVADYSGNNLLNGTRKGFRLVLPKGVTNLHGNGWGRLSRFVSNIPYPWATRLKVWTFFRFRKKGEGSPSYSNLH